MLNEVFNIDTVERLTENLQRVQGRAYGDVHVGDVLTVALAAEGEAPPRLTVVDIVTYGKQTPELNRMLTGTLLLQGSDDGLLQPGGFLYA